MNEQPRQPKSYSLRGCRRDEIEHIARDQGVKLPQAYIKFLERTGCKDYLGHNGIALFYPDILGLKHEAQELLDESPGLLSLPDDALVFTMNQGFQFLFMLASEGDDPPVYHYVEGDRGAVKAYESFTEFLREDAHKLF